MILLPVFVTAQVPDSVKYRPIPMVSQGDSMPGFLLADLEVISKDGDYYKRYRSAKYYVRRVYDYAAIASGILNKYQDSIAGIKSKR